MQLCRTKLRKYCRVDHQHARRGAGGENLLGWVVVVGIGGERSGRRPTAMHVLAGPAAAVTATADAETAATAGSRRLGGSCETGELRTVRRAGQEPARRGPADPGPVRSCPARSGQARLQSRLITVARVVTSRDHPPPRSRMCLTFYSVLSRDLLCPPPPPQPPASRGPAGYL